MFLTLFLLNFGKNQHISRTSKKSKSTKHQNQQKWVKRAKNRLKMKNTRGDPYLISKTPKKRPKTLVFREFQKPQYFMILTSKRSKNKKNHKNHQFLYIGYTY